MNAPFPGVGDPDTYTDYVEHAVVEQEHAAPVATLVQLSDEDAVMVRKLRAIQADLDEVIGDTSETEYLRLRFRAVRDRHFKGPKS